MWSGRGDGTVGGFLFRGKEDASARQIDAICAVYSGFPYLLWTGSSPSPLRMDGRPGMGWHPGPKELLLSRHNPFVSSLSEWLPSSSMPPPLPLHSLSFLSRLLCQCPPPLHHAPVSLLLLPLPSIYHSLCFCLHPLLSSLSESLGPSPCFLSLSFKDCSVPLQEIWRSRD